MSLSDEVDPLIKPGDDLYGFVNNRWLLAHPIPNKKAVFGSLSQVSDKTAERLHALLEKPASSDAPSEVMVAKKLYDSAMNSRQIEKNGTDALRPIFDHIENISSESELSSFIGEHHARGLTLIWQSSIDLDDKDSAQYVLRLSQAGIGLPERDYYLRREPQFVTIRQAYVSFLAEIFSLLGYSSPNARAKNVLRLETKLARLSQTSLDRRDVLKNYHAYTVSSLRADFPNFNWQQYLDQIDCSESALFLVSQPKFISGALDLLKNQPIGLWQDYLRIHSCLPFMSALPKAFDDCNFRFYGTVLSGTKEQEDRFRRVIQLCLSIIPEPVGRIYVESYFPESNKRAIYDLVGDLKVALSARITKLDWMSEATKKKALIKLESFLPLLGYPDEWRDFKGLNLTDNYIENLLAIKAYEWQRDMKRLTGPVNRKEWLMSPALLNAYYWPNTNGITFPAAILQAPLFDPDGDFAANYGGIGVVIGHEMIHGFDDQGALYDELGSLNTWWQSDDWTAFKRKARKLVKQYDAYTVNGQHLSGGLTVGENIADLGGTLVAFDALRLKIEAQGTSDKIDGFNAEQRFFMALARVWRQNIRPELALNLLLSDPHAPNQFRVNGVVVNVDCYYDAFNVTSDEALYLGPKDRIRIW
jgi:putative endopeptidase